MLQEKPDLKAEPSKQDLEAIRASQQGEQADPELRRKRERSDADLNARYRRIREYTGKRPNGGTEQELLLKDVRRHVAESLESIVENILAKAPHDVPEADLLRKVKLRIRRDAYNYLSWHPDKKYFKLKSDEFTEALWAEGFPSLEDRARTAIQKRALTEAIGLRKGQPDPATKQVEPFTTSPGMRRPARSEIEKFATDSFALAHERLAVEYATKRNQVLAQVRLKGNIGGYAPALTELAASQVRDSILACADAYVDAFTASGVPADAKAKKSVETASLQIAGGANSQVRGQLDLLKKRTLRSFKIPGAYINREIEKSRVSAFREGRLKLERQRIEVRSGRKQDSMLASQSKGRAPSPKGDAIVPALPILSLEAHRKDQERRKTARGDLREALENYFSNLTSFKDVEITKLAEIVGAYAFEIYDSSAEGYLAIPSLDPEALFGMAGPLNVGSTLADVEKCLSTLRIRRPWKISSDPVASLLDDGHELMGIHYEHPWFKQEIGNIATKRVQDARKEYEEGSQSPPKANSEGTIHVNGWDSLRSGFMQLRADCAINPPINPAGRLTAIWTALPEPSKWRLSFWEAKDGSGFKERFAWHASEAAALLGCQSDGDDALFYWLDKVKRHAPKQYVRRIVETGPDGADQIYSFEFLDICGLSAEFCRKCKADAIRSLATERAAAKGFREPQRTTAGQISNPLRRNERENAKAVSWATIEISFLSDERVQIRSGTNTETWNYGELGFADRRATRGKPKPKQAWVVLRAMAEQEGIIRDGSKAGAAWPKVERRMQEIRKTLRKHFGITADPVPFIAGTGYQACFKIGCSPSFHT